MPRGACVIPRKTKTKGIVFDVKYVDAAGVQIREKLGSEHEGWTKRKAEAELRERLVRVERKDYRKPSPVTFGEYAETWLEACETKRRWKPRTLLSYTGALARLNPTFERIPLGSIRPSHIAEFVEEALQSYSAATVNLDLTILHDVYKTALRSDLVDRNPCDAVERPRIVRRRWRILEPVEIRRVAKAFEDEQAWLIFLTLVLTGIRRFELQSLRWSDVDLVESVLRVRDSKSEEGIRSIALPKSLAEALWQRRRKTAFQGDDEFVFCHPERGSKIDHEWYAGEFRAALEAADVEGYVRPFHDARHTAITNDAAAGASEVAIMAKAGHRSMNTTKTYLHLAGVVFRDEADRLEQRLLGGTSLYPSEPTSPDLSESDSAQEQALASPLRVG